MRHIRLFSLTEDLRKINFKEGRVSSELSILALRLSRFKAHSWAVHHAREKMLLPAWGGSKEKRSFCNRAPRSYESRGGLMYRER